MLSDAANDTALDTNITAADGAQQQQQQQQTCRDLLNGYRRAFDEYQDAQEHYQYQKQRWLDKQRWDRKQTQHNTNREALREQQRTAFHTSQFVEWHGQPYNCQQNTTTFNCTSFATEAHEKCKCQQLYGDRAHLHAPCHAAGGALADTLSLERCQSKGYLDNHQLDESMCIRHLQPPSTLEPSSDSSSSSSSTSTDTDSDSSQSCQALPAIAEVVRSSASLPFADLRQPPRAPDLQLPTAPTCGPCNRQFQQLQRHFSYDNLSKVSACIEAMSNRDVPPHPSPRDHAPRAVMPRSKPKSKLELELSPGSKSKPSESDSSESSQNTSRPKRQLLAAGNQSHRAASLKSRGRKAPEKQTTPPDQAKSPQIKQELQLTANKQPPTIGVVPSSSTAACAAEGTKPPTLKTDNAQSSQGVGLSPQVGLSVSTASMSRASTSGSRVAGLSRPSWTRTPRPPLIPPIPQSSWYDADSSLSLSEPAAPAARRDRVRVNSRAIGVCALKILVIVVALIFGLYVIYRVATDIPDFATPHMTNLRLAIDPNPKEANNTQDTGGNRS